MYMCSNAMEDFYVKEFFGLHSPVSTKRQPGESKEEKKMRKQAVKEERRACLLFARGKRV